MHEFKKVYDKSDLFFEKIPMVDLVHKEINVPDILDTPIINSGSAVEIKHKMIASL